MRPSNFLIEEQDSDDCKSKTDEPRDGEQNNERPLFLPDNDRVRNWVYEVANHHSVPMDGWAGESTHSKARDNSIPEHIVPSRGDSLVSARKSFASGKVAAKNVTGLERKNVRTVVNDSCSEKNLRQPVRTYSCRSSRSLANNRKNFSSQQHKILLPEFRVPKVPKKNPRLPTTCDDTRKSARGEFKGGSALTVQQDHRPYRRNLFGNQQIKTDKKTDDSESSENSDIFDKDVPKDVFPLERRISLFERKMPGDDHQYHNSAVSSSNGKHLPCLEAQYGDYMDRLEKIDAITHKLVERAKCIEATATKMQMVDSLHSLSSAVSELCFDSRVPCNGFGGVASHCTSDSNRQLRPVHCSNSGAKGHQTAFPCSTTRSLAAVPSVHQPARVFIQQSHQLPNDSEGQGRPRPERHRLFSKRANIRATKSKSESIEQNKERQLRKERLHAAITSDVKVTSLLFVCRYFYHIAALSSCIAVLLPFYGNVG